ncbi:LysE family translocator [Elongatibacter sediminis]|uniref:LysE family translocator n=1 Tax=Elongatibacter sediminis TaxID=3119006 RepID=A0AAW9RGG5_9GAMM
MNLATWLTVVSICMLGAMSPGPSLAVVLRHTLHGGRGAGAVTAIAHGAGVGLYSFASMSGLALLITASPTVFRAFEWAGAAYLAWMGLRGLLARPADEDQPPPAAGGAGAIRDGFLIVFLNPKIAVFFIALFSQVIGSDTPAAARVGYAATAWIIDTAWYLVVAWLFSNPRWLAALRRNAVWFERLFGVILLGLAGRLLLETLK